MVIIFEPGIAQGLKVESGIPQVLISEAGVPHGFKFFKLEFLMGSGFWNSSRGYSSRTCIIDRGCADIKWNNRYLEFLRSLLTDFNVFVSILLACFVFVLL